MCAGLLRNSGSQAIGIEAGISLGLLTDVVLYVEFRVVRVVAFPRLQVSEINRTSFFILSGVLQQLKSDENQSLDFVLRFRSVHASNAMVGLNTREDCM